MRTTDQFVFFWRTEDVYSNWHPSVFVVNGTEYQNAEQFMMAEKARLMGDSATLQLIMATADPRDIKALGRKIKPWDETLWVANRERVMLEGVIAKFDQNPDMLTELLLTEEREIVEASPYDRIWGIGLEENDDRVLDKTHWQGLNLLGIACMQARNHFKSFYGV